MKNALLFISLFLLFGCTPVSEDPVSLDFNVTLSTVDGGSVPGLLGVHCTEDPCVEIFPVDLTQSTNLSFYDLSVEDQSALTLTFDDPIQEYTLGLLNEGGERLLCAISSSQISSIQVSLDLCGLLEEPVFLDVFVVYENGEDSTYYFPLKGAPRDETLENFEFFGVFYNNDEKGGPFVQDSENEDSYFLDQEDLEPFAPDYLSWEGKEVHVQGQAFIHYCSTEEQCLDTGILRSFTRIDSIKLVD